MINLQYPRVSHLTRHSKVGPVLLPFRHRVIKILCTFKVTENKHTANKHTMNKHTIIKYTIQTHCK